MHEPFVSESAVWQRVASWVDPVVDIAVFMGYIRCKPSLLLSAWALHLWDCPRHASWCFASCRIWEMLQSQVSGYRPLWACIALVCRRHLGIVLGMHEYWGKCSTSINQVALFEIVCRLFKPLTCSGIVSFMDVVLIAANMISTTHCNYWVPMSDPPICTGRHYVLLLMMPESWQNGLCMINCTQKQLA